MIGAIILAHLVGDYILQTHHIAIQKTQHWLPAIAHGLLYTVPFLFITLNPIALAIICITHIIIDRYRLAKYLVYLSNLPAPKKFRPTREDMKTTGYPADTPIWLSTWLLFIADNTVHLLINVWAVYTF